MGPQPNSCGNPHPNVGPGIGSFRFNGATAKQLWKRRPGRASPRDRTASMGPQPNSCGNGQWSVAAGVVIGRLQWGHSQTAVETSGPMYRLWGRAELQWGHSQTAVETALSQAKRQSTERFNGATAKQLWKLRKKAPNPNDQIPASMGPQPNSCGNNSVFSP